MANFWAGVGQGFSQGFEKAWDSAARRRERREVRDQALKDRQAAWDRARQAAQDERFERELARDGERAYQEMQKQREAKSQVAAFDPEVREQVGQAPSLIRQDAPSLPYGKDELGYEHPFKGSPDLIEDVVRSLKEEEGETDWLAAAARGARIQSIADKAKENARANQEARERVIFSNTLEALGDKFLAAGEEGVDFTPVDEGVSGMPEHLQKSYYDRGVSSAKIGEAKSAKGFLLEQRKILLQEGAGLASWGYEPINPKTDAEVSDAYASISIAKAKKNLFDTQQKVFGRPPNLTPMGKPEILNLTPAEVNNLTRKWNEALEEQRIKTIGAEAKAKSDATKVTAEEEFERKMKLKGWEQEGLPPYFEWRRVTKEFEDPQYIPNYEKWEEASGKKATQEMINKAKDQMAQYGKGLVFEAPPSGWETKGEEDKVKDLESLKRLREKVRRGEQLHPTEEGELELLEKYYGTGVDKSSPEGVSLSRLNPREKDRIMSIPEGKPFKDNTGALWERRGDKILRVK